MVEIYSEKYVQYGQGVFTRKQARATKGKLRACDKVVPTSSSCLACFFVPVSDASVRAQDGGSYESFAVACFVVVLVHNVHTCNPTHPQIRGLCNPEG